MATDVNRRALILGASCLCGASAFGAEARRPCEDLAAAPRVDLSTREAERHSILMQLAMSLTYDAWGVDQSRADLVTQYARLDPDRRFGAYLGHNIGALLVDKDWTILDFALNRAVQLNSTLEHAEARAVRAAIQAANSAHTNGDAPRWTYGTLLKDARLYTTLAPCEQCAGILALANVGTIVYGQDDPSQHAITNVLYNLGHDSTGAQAPLPIAATFMPSWTALADAYRRFAARAGQPAGLTYFLESPDAYLVFRDAAATFAHLTAQDPANQPLLTAATQFRSAWRNRVAAGLVPT